MISYVIIKFGNKLNLDIFFSKFAKKMVWFKMVSKWTGPKSSWIMMQFADIIFTLSIMSLTN